MNVWQVLGLEPTADKAAIRHAYAKKTKLCHPEEDPEGFNALHQAFTAAMQYARKAPGRQTQAIRSNPVPAPAEPAMTVGMPTLTAGRAAALAEEQAAFEDYLLEQQKEKNEPELDRGGQSEEQRFHFGPA